MSNRRVADRLLAAANTVDEVAHVIGRHLKTGGIRRQRFADEIARLRVAVAGRDEAAIDEDPLAAFSLKENAVALGTTLGILDRPILRRAIAADKRGAAASAGTVAVGVHGLERGMAVVRAAIAGRC